jgi:hypothetical protein
LAALLAIALASAALAQAAAGTGIRSAFVSGGESWKAYSGGQSLTVQFVPVAGNPAGHIASAIPGNGMFDGVFFQSPPSWAGDRGSAYRGSLSFDVHLDPSVTPGYTYVLLSTGAPDFSELQYNIPGAPGANWKRYALPLRSGVGWIDRDKGGDPAGELAFVNVLSNLDSVGIGVSGIGQGDTFYLDNVVLAADVKRKLTLRYGDGRFAGRLTPKGSCAARETIIVYHKRGGPDAKVGTDSTNLQGEYAVPKRDARSGSYYAKAKKHFEVGAGNCFAVRSKSEKVR